MRTGIVMLFLQLSFSLSLLGQISLEFSHTSNVLGPVKLSASGWKYFQTDSLAENKLALYNLDGTLYKNLTLPPNPFDTAPFIAWYVSESLFNTDSSTTDYMLLYLFEPNMDTTMPGPGLSSLIRIADEFGNVLFEEENATTYEVFTTGRYYYSVYATDEGTKMQLLIFNENGEYVETKVYGLAGSYPTGIQRQLENEPGMFQLAPNPNSGSLRLSWDFPQGKLVGQVELWTLDGRMLRSLPIPAGTNQLTEQLPDLQSGMYFYRLIGEDGQVLQSKRMILIR
ncbi:MAG: T9SS type A sorting domain-containing protein [Bacteroidota bacterium]